MAAQAPELLTEGTAGPELIRIFNDLRMEVYQLRGAMTQMNTTMVANQQQQNQQQQGRDSELTRWRTLQQLGKFEGDEKSFKDFEFKLHQFVRQVPGFEKFLDWVEQADVEPNHEAMEQFKAQTGYQLEYLNDQLYGVLSMVTEGNALGVVMNLMDNHDLRGAQSWFRMTRDAAGKTGPRMRKLRKLVHHPKNISKYSDALSQLIDWESNMKELAVLEGQQLAEGTKAEILTHMLPTDLSRAIESGTLKKFNEIWAFALEQVQVRKNWNVKKDPNAMDIDAAEKEEMGTPDSNHRRLLQVKERILIH